MVFPEPTLRAGGLGGLGRLLSIGMNAVERKMAIDYLDIIGVSVYQTL